MIENVCRKAPSEDPHKSWRILLAEDDPVSRLLFKRTLSDQGYTIETACSGEEALNRVLQGGIHILITDWDMPGLDGAQLCRRIRESEVEVYPYILMVTAHESLSDRVFALNAGANDYIKKPLEKPELLARLRSACELVAVQHKLRSTNTELSLANQRLSIAYEEITLAKEKIEQMSRVDQTFGCFNRHHLNEQLPREIERALRYKHSLALLLVDVDHFKHINDTHGHLVGDEILKMLVERTYSALRQSADWIARFGGEEFVVVLPETDLAGAHAVAEKIRALCDDEQFPTSAGPLRVTVSVGVSAMRPSSQLTSLPTTSGLMNDLLEDADRAMYESKELGRNRVSVSVELQL